MTAWKLFLQSTCDFYQEDGSSSLRAWDLVWSLTGLSSIEVSRLYVTLPWRVGFIDWETRLNKGLGKERLGQTFWGTLARPGPVDSRGHQVINYIHSQPFGWKTGIHFLHWGANPCVINTPGLIWSLYSMDYRYLWNCECGGPYGLTPVVHVCLPIFIFLFNTRHYFKGAVP